MEPELERMPNATVSFCNMSPVDMARALLSLHVHGRLDAPPSRFSLPCKSMPNSVTFMPERRRNDFAKCFILFRYAFLKYSEISDFGGRCSRYSINTLEILKFEVTKI